MDRLSIDIFPSLRDSESTRMEKMFRLVWEPAWEEDIDDTGRPKRLEIEPTSHPFVIDHARPPIRFSKCYPTTVLQPNDDDTRGLGRYWFSLCSESFPLRLLPCRDGTVVRALPSHQCGPGSIPRLGVICGLSLLVLYSAPRGFSPGTPVFPSPQKPTFDLI